MPGPAPENMPVISFRTHRDLIDQARATVGEGVPTGTVIRLALARLAGVDPADYEPIPQSARKPSDQVADRKVS